MNKSKEVRSKEDDLILTLSPIERAIIPYLSQDIDKIVENSKLDRTTVERALTFLENKEIIKLQSSEVMQVSLGDNGAIYLKQELPERRLLNALSSSSKSISLKEATEKSGLSENEFKIALGVLKRKTLIKLSKDGIGLEASKDEVSKKMFEEKFLESLPINLDKLEPEQKFALEQLKSRKDVIRIEKLKQLKWQITEVGKRIVSNGDKLKLNLIEQLTPDIIMKGTWKGKEFRRYDIHSKIPKISGGRRQPYLEFLQEVREQLIALGFAESTGPIVELSFFNSDALFMPQDHPARGIHDLYFTKPEYGSLSKYKTILKNIKETQENGWKTGSEGWNTKFSEKESSRLVLRSQGTAISARILANKPKIPGKYFAIARCFRPDIIDASHLAEFNQMEGIVLDKSVNFKNLLGMLKVFAEKMTGSKKVKFLPSYFPFTEPSVEMYIYHEKLKKWIEMGGAGIFRPELTIPMGIKEPVLAWGMGIDRLYMIRENIHDIRQLFSTNLKYLRA
jgi:phenylalanyl-tRNA synthetase alpha chain